MPPREAQCQSDGWKGRGFRRRRAARRLHEKRERVVWTFCQSIWRSGKYHRQTSHEKNGIRGWPKDGMAWWSSVTLGESASVPAVPPFRSTAARLRVGATAGVPRSNRAFPPRRALISAVTPCAVSAIRKTSHARFDRWKYFFRFSHVIHVCKRLVSEQPRIPQTRPRVARST